MNMMWIMILIVGVAVFTRGSNLWQNCLKGKLLL